MRAKIANLILKPHPLMKSRAIPLNKRCDVATYSSATASLSAHFSFRPQIFPGHTLNHDGK